jgi:DNA-binding IclR family transcriptional regulator
VISPDRFRRALVLTRVTRVAITRWELEPGTSGIAMPVFGPGGQILAAVELVVRDPGHELQRLIPPLSIATRSLSRELVPAHELLRDIAPTQRHIDRPPLVALNVRAVS